VDVLVVSGGGSGGAGYGGGGGGGAVKYFTDQSISGATAITVGAGGAAVSTAAGKEVGKPGESSRFGLLIATSSSSANGPNSFGGGGGGGGSGGGAGGNLGTTPLPGGTAVSGMGNNGGNSRGNNVNFSNICGGGGGGAGAVGGFGGTLNSNRGGTGGVGVSNSITGVAVFYGGGGGGGVTFNGTAGGAGGNGGGGAGSKGDVTATSATANTGGGGGGFGSSNGGASNNLSGAGGSGIVIVRYLGSVIRATGGTVTQVGNYTIHTFYSSGTFTTFTVEPTISTSSTATAVCKSTSTQNSALAYSATTLAPTTYSISWSGTPANSFEAVTDATLTTSPISIPVPANTAEGTYTGTITVKNAAGDVSTGTNFTITVNAVPEWYLDADGDHYYTGVAVPSCTSPGAGYTTSGLLGGGDCDDANIAINPNATEICYNGIDDNCSGSVNEGCAVPTVNMTSTTVTLTSFSIAVAARPYSLSPYTNLKYRFTITKIQTGQSNEVQELTSSSRFVTIPQAMRSYTATYTIRAAAVINDEILAYLGNTMTVTPPSVELVTLSPSSCGATLSSLNATISANGGLNATGYIFRIRKAVGTDSLKMT
jgi:hypothetical protein